MGHCTVCAQYRIPSR